MEKRYILNREDNTLTDDELTFIIHFDKVEETDMMYFLYDRKVYVGNVLKRSVKKVI